MTSLEQVTYDAGRQVLADQEALVAGIRQRAGTLLAAHALVASFLGATTLRAVGATLLAWLALLTLVAGLVIAAILLAPWRTRFSLDADEIYWHAWRLRQSRTGAGEGTWLLSLALLYQSTRDSNDRVVKAMTRLSLALSGLAIAQTMLWTIALTGVVS